MPPQTDAAPAPCRCWVCGEEFEVHPSALLSDPLPRYCGKRCRTAAYYSRMPCTGCGEPSFRNRYGGPWCVACHALLRGHCWRKRRYATADEAPDVTVDGETLYPYDCLVGCAGVHTTTHTGDLIPDEYHVLISGIAARARAAGLDMQAVRARSVAVR